VTGDDTFEPDSVGFWSERKLSVVRDYAQAYSTILSAQVKPAFYHIYIDGFAGAGIHLSRETGDLVPGSPLNALLVNPLFREYHLVEIDAGKLEILERLAAGRTDVFIHPGDCNDVLPERVLPSVRYEDYRRALCFLDPYGLHLKWRVIETTGRLGTVDLYLNFPILDMNRNVLLRDPSQVDARQARRMTDYWGDESWRKLCYTNELDLFGKLEKESNERVVRAFCARLSKGAGFRYVAQPLAMRNSVGAAVYYLLFASQKRVALDIAEDIHKRHMTQGS
jgi:three-Cys-motif partner protein